MLLVGICGKHGDGIYIYIYILEESVMQADGAMTPCLYTALMALTTDKGGTTVGEAMAHFPLPELPPSTLAGDRATRRQGKNGPVLRACPHSHAQPEPGRPSYKSVRTRAGQLHEARGGREMRMGVMDRGGFCRIKTWSRHCRWPNTLRV